MKEFFYIISERQGKVNRVDQVFIKERNLEKEKIYTSKKQPPQSGSCNFDDKIIISFSFSESVL